jgi:peptidoglycan/LPS O-acetylase OafA/YrhL
MSAASLNAEASPVSRLPGPDLLRAIAISWVMLYHASLFRLDLSDYWIVRFGWMGVDLFFVLSGFLIAGQLLRPFERGDKPNCPRFFVRRLLRTLPAYLVVVAVYFMFPAVRERPNIQPLWQFLTFTQNLLIAAPLPKAFSPRMVPLRGGAILSCLSGDRRSSRHPADCWNNHRRDRRCAVRRHGAARISLAPQRRV